MVRHLTLVLLCLFAWTLPLSAQVHNKKNRGKRPKQSEPRHSQKPNDPTVPVQFKETPIPQRASLQAHPKKQKKVAIVPAPPPPPGPDPIPRKYP